MEEGDIFLTHCQEGRGEVTVGVNGMVDMEEEEEEEEEEGEHVHVTEEKGKVSV